MSGDWSIPPVESWVLVDGERLDQIRRVARGLDIPPETIGSVDPFYIADGAVGDVLKLAQYYATHEWETRIGQVPVARAVYDRLVELYPDEPFLVDFRPVGRAVATRMRRDAMYWRNVDRYQQQ